MEIWARGKSYGSSTNTYSNFTQMGVFQFVSGEEIESIHEQRGCIPDKTDYYKSEIHYTLFMVWGYFLPMNMHLQMLS